MGDESASPSDDALVRAALRAPADFDALYRRHLHAVYRYVLARLGDEQTAQDLTAQTFLAALEGLASYRGTGTFRAWLLGIARNHILTHLRARQWTQPLEAAEHLPDTHPSPEDIVLAQLDVEHALRAMRALAPDRAEALALRVFGGLSMAEVGRVMGKSEAAVKMLIHRAIHDLHQRLDNKSEARP